MFIRARLFSTQYVTPLVRWRPTANTIVTWSPVLVSALYFVVFVVRFPTLIRRVYWDSDAAMFTVAAQTVGNGSVFVLAHAGWFTSLWFLLLTRSVPLHRQVWEIAPMCFALATVALLAWCTWRLAGRWAAAMTASIGVAASPIVNYSRLALDFHGDAWMVAVVLAAFALWLVHRPPHGRVAAAAALVAVAAGTTLASDALFAVVGLIPFALTGLVFLLVLRMRFEGFLILACSAASVLVDRVTESVMTRLDVVVSPRAPLQLASLDALWSNAKHLVGLIVEGANGGYTQAGWAQPALSFDSILSLACGVLMLAALAAPLFLLVREARSRPRSNALLVWACFWALSIGGNSAGYVLSKEGAQWGYYLVPVLYAAAATVPIVLSTSVMRRRVGGLAISVVLGASLLNLFDRTDMFGGLPPLASVAGRIAAIAKAEHAPYGYTADYWDASSLTWNTDLAVHVQPLWYCSGEAALCPFLFNVVSTWYQPHHSRSFVVQPTAARVGSAAYNGLGMIDPSATWIDTATSSLLGPPSAAFRLNNQFTMYIYPYDVASRLDDHTNSVWAPSFTYGNGFNAAEPFNGTTSRWMIQDGQIDIHVGVASELTLSGVAFSNQRPRVLELVDDAGRVLGRAQVPTSAARFRFGPLSVPAGHTTLSLVAAPGPQRLGASDPRQATVFIEPLTLAARPGFAPGASPPA